MAEPTVEEVLKLDDTKKAKSKPALWIPLLWFLVFPPVGIYMLWKEETFHFWLAIISILFGAFNLLSALLSLTAGHLSIVLVVLFLSIIQIAVSIILLRKAKARGYLEVSELTTLVILIVVVDYIVVPFLFSWLIWEFAKPYFEGTVNDYQQYQQFNLPLN